MNSRDGRGFEFNDVPGLLRHEFPELRPALDALEEFHRGETNEPYFVWAVIGSVFWPYLEQALARPGVGDSAQLMAFVERLASHSDSNVKALAAVEVAYALLGKGRGRILQRARGLMGPATAQRLLEQEQLITAATSRR